MLYTYYFYILLIPLPFWLLLNTLFNTLAVLNFFYHDSLCHFDDFVDDTTNNDNKEIKENKYEDKFLTDIRKLNKEYIFDERENELLEEKKGYFLNILINDYQERKKEIETNINEIDDKINNSYKKEVDEKVDEKVEEKVDEKQTEDEKENEEDYETFLINALNQKNNLITELKKLEEFLESEDGKKDILLKSQENARDFIINQRIEKLANCYVMETTPQGNVLMIYDKKCDSFKYYSDNTIPYRYLEVVGRKYVKFFNCRPLYVDMEEELKLAEEKWEKEREEKEKEEKKQLEYNNSLKKDEKKNVFAKFKSYNKEGVTGRVNKGVPPKNSITITKEQENQKILLKERANRYTYEGKMANFSFLKKIDRKVVDKKYGVSFADFKKIQIQNQKYNINN
jgi:hypothetical protein